MNLLSEVKKLPRNQKNTISLLPLMWWLIPSLIFYLPMYMKETGLNDIEIGSMYTVSNFIGFLFLSVSAPLINKLGRKNSILIFELLSWAVPFALFLFWGNYGAFIIGFSLIGLAKVGNVALISFLTEAVDEKKYPSILSILNMVYLAPGIITPIFGLFINRMGITSVVRVIFAIQVCSVVSAVFIRNFIVSESEIGLNKMNQKINIFKHVESSFRNAFISYKDKTFSLAGFLHLCTMIVLVSLNAFQGLYIIQQVELNHIQLSLVPAIAGISNLFIFFLVLPKLSKRKPEIVLIEFILLGIAAMFILIYMPKGNTIILVIYLLLSSASQYVIFSIRDVVIIKSTPSESKTESYAAVQLVTGLAVIPVGTLAGILFNINNVLLFFAIIVIHIVMLMIALWLLALLKK